MSESNEFPELVRYLAALPSGIDSYPDCRAKASLYRSVADASPIREADRDALPKPLLRLLTHPVPISSWIPEVHSHALMLAIYDRCFSSVEEFTEFTYQRQRNLFGGRVYSIALHIVTPKMLVKTAAIRFGMFHRGTDFVVSELEATGAMVNVTCPPGVYDDISRIALCEGLRAALDLCMGGGASVKVVETTRSRTTIRVRWP